jgi:hypothetical protein
MSRAAWESAMARLINKHVRELRSLVAEEVITGADHDRVGCMVRDHIADLISMSDAAWKKFISIIDESRALQQYPHEP